MIRDFVHLIQNKLRHYAVFPSLHSLSRSSAFQTALFLLGVLAFARACIFLAPPSVTTLASASVNGTFMPICRVETDQKKVALTFNCTYSAQDMQQLLEILKEKNVHATFFVSDTWAKNYPELLCTIHNAGHDIGDLLGHILPERDIIEEEHGRGAGADDVVHAHCDAVDAYGIVAVGKERKLQLRSHAVRSGNQSRLFHPLKAFQGKSP